MPSLTHRLQSFASTPTSNRTGLLSAGLLAAFTLLGACAPGDSSANFSACEADHECRRGGVCVNGRCQPPTDPVDDPDAGPGNNDSGPTFEPDPYARSFCPDFPFTAADCDDSEKARLMAGRDSDEDGLSDYAEVCEHGTNPCNADTDGDGVSDLVEVGYGSDPNDPNDNPQSRGDFVFVMPYQKAASPERDTLDFATDLQVVDVYFLMDTTGSMGNSIASLKATLATFIPQIRAEIPNVWIGHGDFKDYPVNPYGSAGLGDFVYRNYQSLTENESEAVASLSKFGSAIGGNDGPEAQIPALYAVASGEKLPGTTNMWDPEPCAPGHWGYPCFRDNAVPIVALITDIYMHNGPGNAYPYNDATIGGHAPTYQETVDLLNEKRVRVIGIGQGSSGVPHMQTLARDTGTVDEYGEPLVSVWNNSTVADTVLAQIQILAKSTRLDISAHGVNNPAESVDVVAAFVDRVEANPDGDPARDCEPRAAADPNSVGYNDTFPDVLSGNRVCFDIVPKTNTTVEPTDEPQLFRANIQVLGDGFTPLDEREVMFLVPPKPVGAVK